MTKLINAPTMTLSELPAGVFERVTRSLEPAELAQLALTSRGVRTLVAADGWSRAHYGDAVVHGTGGAPDSAGWRALALQRASLRAAAGRLPHRGGGPQPPRMVTRLLHAGLYDAALVAMQPLPAAAVRSTEQTEQLAAALTGLGRAAEAAQQRAGGDVRHALPAGLHNGEVAAVSAALAAGAQPGASHVGQLVERLGNAGATPDGALAIWHVLVSWWLEHEDAPGFMDCLARAAAANLSAPTRVAMATTLAAHLGPSHYADPAVRRACCALIGGSGAALPMATVVALLDGLAPGAMTAANLQRLRELGVDLAACDPATDGTFLHAHDWQAAGGAQALRHALAAGADPWVRDRQKKLPLASALDEEVEPRAPPTLVFLGLADEAPGLVPRTQRWRACRPAVWAGACVAR